MDRIRITAALLLLLCSSAFVHSILVVVLYHVPTHQLVGFDSFRVVYVLCCFRIARLQIARRHRNNSSSNAGMRIVSIRSRNTSFRLLLWLVSVIVLCIAHLVGSNCLAFVSTTATTVVVQSCIVRASFLPFLV